ncbi:MULTISPECIES: S66 peptidase family protein [Halomonas]|uniref:Murein tetrapeptide carboxypeptidase n=1 Tax=Halomonas halophila TaxID=29573 RepID=A0ABQ0U322_9GAMM|nr:MULTISPECIES: LD-carboxypeptidase [Halomonas]MDR5889844.1 LD-carboxypeptidase [Halomonas salina]WJY06753.1 LD-carboxypeptidase [Halomonas halophila]GEK72845.1 murein tetrapeptide carboxypeptidase [Halomonas halophila]
MPLAVSLIAPSSFTAPEAIDAGLRGLEALGVEVRLETPLQAPQRYLAGSRAYRLDQLHAAFGDPETQAVWAVRGGYGAAQLIDGIDWRRLARSNKPLIGYSDVTVLLDHCHRHGVPAIHGPVAKAAAGMLEGSDDERRIVRQQFEETLALIAGPTVLDYPIAPWAEAPTTLEGPVVGGNLATLASLVGTPAGFRAPPGSLVILEDVGEPYYRLERALWQLMHGGALDRAAAVCLGTFEGCRPYGDTPLEAIVAETLAPLGLPLYTGLPSGHGLHNRPWRYGASGRIADGRLSVGG